MSKDRDKLENYVFFPLLDYRKKKKFLLYVFLTIFLVFLLLFIYQIAFNKDNNYFKFHNRQNYTPLNADRAGFYGRTNHYLALALNDTNLCDYHVSKLDSFYKRLRFYYPDSSDYLVSVNDIRLIDYIPSEDLEEREFFYNSYFYSVLEKQKKDLNRQYFRIIWNKNKTRIKSIFIDTTLFNLPLNREVWKGSISFNDPFFDADKNVSYVSYQDRVLPLFSSSQLESEFKAGLEYYVDFVFKKNDIFYNNKQLNQIDYFHYFNELQQNHKTTRLIFEISESRRCYLKILNTGNSISLMPEKLYDCEFFVNNEKLTGTRNFLKDQTKGHGVLYIVVKTPRHEYRFEIHNNNEKSPVSNVSVPLNLGLTGERIVSNYDGMDLFTRQLIHQVGAGVSNLDNINSVNLSVNTYLSKYLENKIKDFVKNELVKNPIYNKTSYDVFEMSMCLMDISTGELIAAPYYSNEFEKNNINELVDTRNFNLVRHDIGSTFKPLMSYAAYLRYPELSGFSLFNNHTNYNSMEGTCNILGYSTRKYGMLRGKPNEQNQLFWSPCNNRIEFLAKSHDNYPIALAMLALVEGPASNSDAGAYDNIIHFNNDRLNDLHTLLGDSASRILYKPRSKSIIFRENENATFFKILKNIYDIREEYKDEGFASITYDTFPWRLLKTKNRYMFSVYPDLVYVGLGNFGNINSGDNDFIKFKTFVLGQGDNQWTNIKLAEAYSRLLSKQKVFYTFVKNKVETENLVNGNQIFGKDEMSRGKANDRYNSVWVEFMRDWRQAVKQSPRLLTHAHNVFESSRYGNNQYYFYCKTGTPQENNELVNRKVFKKGKNHIYRDEGLFVFGITNKNEMKPTGIVGVVYIKHLSLNDPKDGVESVTARNFLTKDIYNNIMFHTIGRFGK